MMKALLFLSLLQVASGLLFSNTQSFGIKSSHHVVKNRSDLRMSFDDKTLDRRSMLSITSKFLPAAAVLSSNMQASLADEGSSKKIVVFGGSGYVGAHVDQLLASQGYKVVSVSRSSPQEQAAKVSKILGGKSPSVEYVALDASTDDLSEVLAGADAVVSCLGIQPGKADQRDGNGAVNVRIADAAKAAGIKRFVYISVASSLANSPAKFVLGEYFKGKSEAEAAVVKDFSTDNRLVVKPAIIEGGPPGELRPPGPPGVKPASVDSVARVVVAGALGQESGTIDGNDAIAAF